MKRILLLGLLIVAWCAGCMVRYRGQEAFSFDPDLDIWVRHPHAATTNAEPGVPP